VSWKITHWTICVKKFSHASIFNTVNEKDAFAASLSETEDVAT